MHQFIYPACTVKEPNIEFQPPDAGYIADMSAKRHQFIFEIDGYPVKFCSNIPGPECTFILPKQKHSLARFEMFCNRVHMSITCGYPIRRDFDIESISRENVGSD
jgi:hypothetical protein